MANSYFRFKQFTIQQDACAMKVTTDACLFGAWCARELAMCNVQTVLDVGSGTGLLSLMVSQKRAVMIDAIEIDAAAAAQAAQNVSASSWKENIAVHHADILNWNRKNYDCIISNPPFYEQDLQGPDEKRNTAHHSRQLTLQALTQVLAKQLNARGVFFLLLPYKRRDEAVRVLSKHRLFLQSVIIVRQTENHLPFRIMLKGSFANTPCQTAAITIASAMQRYTPEFTELLKDYYLYL